MSAAGEHGTRVPRHGRRVHQHRVGHRGLVLVRAAHAAVSTPVPGARRRHHRRPRHRRAQNLGAAAVRAVRHERAEILLHPIRKRVVVALPLPAGAEPSRPVQQLVRTKQVLERDVRLAHERRRCEGGGPERGPRRLGLAHRAHGERLGGQQTVQGGVEGCRRGRQGTRPSVEAPALHDGPDHLRVQVALARLVRPARAVVLPVVGVQHRGDGVVRSALQPRCAAFRGVVARQPEVADAVFRRGVLGQESARLVETQVGNQVVLVVRLHVHRAQVVRNKLRGVAHRLEHHHVVDVARKVLPDSQRQRVAAVELGHHVHKRLGEKHHLVHVHDEYLAVVRHRHVHPLPHDDVGRRAGNAERLRAHIDPALQVVLSRHAGGHERQPVALAADVRLLGNDVLAAGPRVAHVRRLHHKGVHGELRFQVQRVRVRDKHRHASGGKHQGRSVSHIDTETTPVLRVVGRMREGAEAVRRLIARRAGVPAVHAHRLQTFAHAHGQLVHARHLRLVRHPVSAVVQVLPLPVEVVGPREENLPLPHAALCTQVAPFVHRLHHELHLDTRLRGFELVQREHVVLVVIHVRHGHVGHVRVEKAAAGVQQLGVGICEVLQDADFVPTRDDALKAHSVRAVVVVGDPFPRGERQHLRVQVQRSNHFNRVVLAPGQHLLRTRIVS
mmetsp:Transcript_41854/g.80001  ORF Transcript_41854/g.80001 Transcript_41854/m.80001 type:complete len:670 (-) Transcript_41854:754-2763(-)